MPDGSHSATGRPTVGTTPTPAATTGGVNHDGDGQLAGYAYGANIGWITFEQAQGQPRIDLRTGNLSGYAWGANVGWISLSNAQAYVQSTLAPGPDTDGDGIPDAWEQWRTGGLTTLSNGLADADADGVPDASEYLADTDPLTGEHLEILSLVGAHGTNTVTWSSRPTRLYQVEATNGLADSAGGWTNVGGGLLGPPAVSPAQASVAQAGATATYYRVRAVVPLAPLRFRPSRPASGAGWASNRWDATGPAAQQAGPARQTLRSTCAQNRGPRPDNPPPPPARFVEGA
jgi:hypothetical protein